MWGMAPSSWNRCSSRFVSLDCPSDAQNFVSSATKRSVFTVRNLLLSSNQYGPVMPFFETTTHAVHVVE